MARWSRRGWAADGFTFIEMVIVCALTLILASAALPLARVTIKRQREVELRRDLRDMRTAIDKYKDAADSNKIAPGPTGSDNYPTDMQSMVDGVPIQGDTSGNKLKFLRQIPIDPMTGKADWVYRSYQDQGDALVWGGQNVYDVHSASTAKALDGTKYKDW